MILSIFYMFSAIMIMGILFFWPKSEEKQEGIIWLPVCYIAYECIISLAASIFTIVHISANLLTIGIMNLLIVVAGGLLIRKRGNIQKYYFNIENIIFLLVMIVIVIAVAFERYGNGFPICFETSDPGTHLKLAMDTVNSQSVMNQTMYVGPFTNGIFIGTLSPVFNGVNVYKSFIIKEVINFGLSGVIFYSCIYKFLGTRFFKFMGMGITLFYLLGYPYSNMLFGFSYLGLGVSIIAFILFLVDFYLEQQENQHILLFLISLGCFGVAGCYTLFAPVVFVAVFICIAYKNKCMCGKVILSKQFYFKELQVFLIPTLLTLWYTIIYPRIIDSETAIEYGSALNIEGYIYRNLYSDFLIWLPLAVYAIYSHIYKKRKLTLTSILFLVMILYAAVLFKGMYSGIVSTYYYYKLNFVIWLLVLVLFVEGISILAVNNKGFVLAYCGCWGTVFLLWFFGTDMHLYNKNVLFNPFPNAKCFFEIYDYNRTIRERKKTISTGLVELCKEVDKHYKDSEQVTMFMGYWWDNYWYEALTNQRQNGEYFHYNPSYYIQNFINGMYGNYLAVEKNEETFIEFYPLIQDFTVVYENEYGFIIKRE